MTELAEPTRTRGAHLLDAVLAVVAEEGLTGLSMRAVAARAGVSLAQVQYYFHSRAELVSAAFDHAGGQFLTGLVALPPGALSLRRLREIVWLWLPLDPQREARARVWVAYTAAAATDRQLAAAAGRLDVELRDWFTRHLAELERAGQIRPGLPLDTTAAQLLALVDGLVVHALLLPGDQRENLAARVLGTWLDRLAPATDPRPGR